MKIAGDFSGPKGGSMFYEVYLDKEILKTVPYKMEESFNKID